MKLILRCFLEKSPSLDFEETVDELCATLFNDTDVDQSGDISFQELFDGFKRNEHLFKILSLRFESLFIETIKEILFLIIFLSTSTWIQPKRAAIGQCQNHTMTAWSYLRNNIGLVFFWSLYTMICILICINVFYKYVGIQKAHFLVVIARLNG